LKSYYQVNTIYNFYNQKIDYSYNIYTTTELYKKFKIRQSFSNFLEKINLQNGRRSSEKEFFLCYFKSFTVSVIRGNKSKYSLVKGSMWRFLNNSLHDSLF
jgi:hypothetical protein